MALFFAELCVRGMALCLLTTLALLLMRHAAATYRHLLCTLALGGLLTLPLVQELLPPLPLLKAERLTSPTPNPSLPRTFVPHWGREGSQIKMPMPLSSPISPFPSEERAPGRGVGERLPTRRDLSFVWLLAWALGTTFLFLRLAIALLRLRGLAQRSQRTTLLETKVLVSEHIATPLTWGVRRPVILLPNALLTGDPAVAESALRHEKAHIARRDWLWHLLAEVVCALCWFQPGAWWLRRRLRAESERACDDRVLLSGISGPDYAAHLLEILKVGRGNLLAPGMAAVGGMEARIQHILDPKKPRRSHGLRLALTAALGLVLLPLASLKVAAKPGAHPSHRLREAVELFAPKLTFLTPSALLAQAKATLVAPKPLEPMPLAEPTLAQPNGTLAMPHSIAPPQGRPAAEPPHPDSTIPLDKVVWGMRVDGLEPGFLLTGVTLIEDKVGTLEIGYTALLRNTTKQPITFLVRLLQYDGYDVPFTQDDSAKIPDTERAKCVPHTQLGRDAVNLITLAPGESVLVPGQEAHHNLQVLIGSGDGGKSPYFEKIKKGMDTLVQPLTVYRSPDMTKLPLHETKCSLTKMSPDGTLHTEGAINVSMPGSGGTQLEAKLWLPKILGTSKTPAASEPDGRVISLNKVVWGEAVDGLEPGFLLVSSDPVPQNSRVVYQALLRNKSNKPISFFVRMLRDNGPDRPWFGVRRAEGTGEPPPFEPLYEASLAPGEAMLVPVQQSIGGTQELVFGDDGSKERPRVSESWLRQYRITQPITLYRGLEKSQLTRLLGSAVPEIKKISSDGTLRTVRSSRVGGKALPGAQTLEATRMLDVVAALPSASGPTIPLDKVIWKEAADGLQAGFLLTSSPRVPMNSKLTYQTLVRNTSNKPISFMTRLLQYDGYEAPTVDGKPTKGAKRGYPLDPLYSVTLAPGESVIVPAQNGRENLEIYVGEGGSSDSPSIAAITPGQLKIVQPIKIYRSPENFKLADMMGIYTLSKVSPEGRVRTEGANRATGLGGGTGRIEGGQTLEAHIYLEVGTLNAAAERNASAAVWGKVDRGLQCGIRMLTDQRIFKTGDTLEAELLWRNVGDKKAHWVRPMQLDIVPLIRKASGSECMVDMGARFRLLPGSTDYAPGEVRSLGTLKVTLIAEGTPSPKSNREPGHITLAPGTYFFSGSGGVSHEGDPCPHSGEVAFTVVGDAPSQSDIELALRLPKGVTTFSKLSEARFEVVLRNRSDKPLTASWITPANFGFYGPDLFTNERVPKPIPYVHTVGGPYRGEDRQLASGETIVLGTIQIPREARATLDEFPRPGLTVSTDLIVPSRQFYAYEARFSLGITVPGKGEQQLSARLPFTVTRS